MQQILFLINITQSYWMKLLGTNEGLVNHGILFHRHDRPFSSIWTSVLPLEARTFEKKQIFQEEQKTIFAIIKPVLGIFF